MSQLARSPRNVAVAAAVLELCDGTRTEADIRMEFFKRHGAVLELATLTTTSVRGKGSKLARSISSTALSPASRNPGSSGKPATSSASQLDWRKR